MASIEEPIESNFWDNHRITYPCKDMKKTLWWVGKFHHPLKPGKFLFLFCSFKEKEAFEVNGIVDQMSFNIYFEPMPLDQLH